MQHKLKRGYFLQRRFYIIIWIKMENPQNRLMKQDLILQGLGVGSGSVTERWSFRKRAKKSFFFVKKMGEK